jgi:sugar phosphate isomerase/epimerase
VQLSDVAATTELEPEPEAMTARLLPGDGVVDYAELWEAFDHIGATPVVAAEVMASALVAEGASSMAAKVHDACRAVLP